ncbi:hypothetical protein E2C01_002337 [Portunus trituberculatus]|uniref:Uncharacterized protein n=1 Tax=Portunus trituberculatus TaxID=210409 RepID=A0A5B7CKQ7_PORTR|nr:hypothetical protein [Portunus trituberculatus]
MTFLTDLRGKNDRPSGLASGAVSSSGMCRRRGRAFWTWGRVVVMVVVMVALVFFRFKAPRGVHCRHAHILPRDFER